VAKEYSEMDGYHVHFAYQIALIWFQLWNWLEVNLVRRNNKLATQALLKCCIISSEVGSNVYLPDHVIDAISQKELKR
jgi:hypothetical protein